MTDGVLPNPSTNLQVQTGSGMTVVVNPGFAICNGCLKLEETRKELTLDASDGTYNRIDTIVVRLNDNDSVRSCELDVISGVTSTTPVRPELTQSESIWEIGLADIFINANSTEITSARITDTRYETDRCGIISAIAEFDTTTLYEQVQSDLTDFQNVSQAEFDTWFENIRGQLEGDVAANLQNQIGTLSELTTSDKTDLVKAINEVAAKEVSVLDTKEEILANTDAGKCAGASGVKEMFTEVTDSLTANGTRLYADYQNGKYGVNTDANRGADTFIPFSGGVEKGSFTLTLNGFSGTASIEFSSPFSKIPIVMCVREDTQGFYGSISDITVNGCTIGVSSTSNNDKNGTFTWHWCAFETD